MELGGASLAKTLLIGSSIIIPTLIYMNCCRKNTGYKIKGEVKEGYEPVKELFETFYETGQERHSQLCIYVGSECVVDIYGTKDKILSVAKE